MADYLALDWERHTVCGVEARISGSDVRVVKCFQLAWPEGATPAADPSRAGAWLKDQLSTAGVKTTQTLITLPREDCVVRHLELPNAPDEELPALVQMQAATRSASALDQLLLDFVPLPTSAGSDGRDVLMTTISTAQADRIRTAVAAAGLELESIGVCPAAVAELVVRHDARSGRGGAETSLVVGRHGDQVELTFLREQRLVFTHSTQLSHEDDARDDKLVLAEISRSTVSHQRILAGGSISRCLMLGSSDEAGSLADALSNRLSCDVSFLDPLEDTNIQLDTSEIPGARGLYAGPVGQLLAHARPMVETINFLDPRKPEIKQDRRKLKTWLVAGGVAALIAMVWGGFKLWESSLDGRIDSLTKASVAKEKEIKAAQPMLKAHGLLDEWNTSRVDQLAQLQDVAEVMPPARDAFLTSYRVSTDQGAAVARVKAVGFARDRIDAQRFSQQAAVEGYTVIPLPIGTSRKQPPYGYTFDVEALRPRGLGEAAEGGVPRAENK